MKKALLLMMAIATVAMSASATKIYVCGTKITGTTSFSAGGGTVSYDASTNTLNISNVSYTKTGSSNNGISVDEVSSALTINMSGSVYFDIGNADAVLCKSGKVTKINISGTATFLTRSNDHAGLKLQDGTVKVQGSGTLTIHNSNSSSSACAIKGGTGHEFLYCSIKRLTVESNGPRFNNLALVSFEETSYYDTGDYSNMSTFITLKPGSSNTLHANNVTMLQKDERIHLLLPIDYYNMSIETYLKSSDLSNKEVQISDYVPAVVFTASNFPDANFRGYLQYIEPKGYLTTSEMNNYTYLNLSNENISNLQGIDQFKNLKELRVENNNLTSLPSGLTNTLEILDCSNNKFSGTFSLTGRSALKTLNISSNPSITTLNCYSNALTSLDVNGCSALTTLDCHSNKFSGTFSLTGRSALKTLNISSNPSITTLNCYDNALTELNVSGCSAMTTLDCHSNQLTSLGNLPSTLQELYCWNNKFSGTFSLTGHSALKKLSISYNPSITTLNCYSNALTSLSLSECSALTTLNCYDNALTELNVSVCSALTTLDCHSNQLTSLSRLPASLQTLNCSSNKFSGTFSLTGHSALKTLNISSNPSITTLYCYGNALTTLDVTNCSAMTYLDCSNNALTALNLSGCSAMTTLFCDSNQLTSLSNLPNGLQSIHCSSNKFSGTLSITNRSALKTLHCSKNSLTSLDVNGCSALTELDCGRNQLTSLNVQGCNALRTLYCFGNQIKESAMTTLVTSLCTIPASSTGTFDVIYPGLSSGGYTEGNVITDAQVRTARNKRWIPRKWDGSSWVEIPVSSSAIPGDVNGDGYVTSADVTAIYDVLLGTDYQFKATADVNGDGYVTSADVTFVYDILLGN